MGKGVYQYSLREATEWGEADEWRESRKLNRSCTEAIEEAIRKGFDGMHLDENCAKSVIDEYGFSRVKWVLSNTLREHSHDGRFSTRNRAWLSSVHVPIEESNYSFSVSSHPAVLDGFIDQVHEEWNNIGLFRKDQCIPEGKGELNYEGQLIVFSADNMSEEHLHPEEQLFLAEGGFGCYPNSRGTKIFGRFLCDDEKCHITRGEVDGILRDEFIPDWARDRMNEVLNRQVVRFGDDCHISIPNTPIDCSALGYFDRLEDQCWKLVKDYLDTMGIKLMPDQDGEAPISFDIAKDIQDRILENLQNAGVKFQFDPVEDQAEKGDISFN